MGKVAQSGWRCQRTDLKSALGDQGPDTGGRSADRGDFESFQTLPCQARRSLHQIFERPARSCLCDRGPSTVTQQRRKQQVEIASIVEPLTLLYSIQASHRPGKRCIIGEASEFRQNMHEQAHFMHYHKALRGRPRLQQFAQLLRDTLWGDGSNGGRVCLHALACGWLNLEGKAGSELYPPQHPQRILRKSYNTYLA